MQENRSDQLTVSLPCEDCGYAFECILFHGVKVTRYCGPCREARTRALEMERAESHSRTLANRRHEWLSDSQRGIPRKYQGATWGDFLFDRGGEGNRVKVGLLKQYAADFPIDRRPWGSPSLLIARNINGVGKTLLACLILQDIINRYEEIGREVCPFQFWPVSRIKLRLRNAERYGSQESQEQVYRDFATMSLLVIDDVGKEKMEGADASFTYETYFNIINERYNNQLPLILTSNLKFDPWYEGGASLVDLMGSAGVSRLMEMAQGTVYIIEGEDRR